MKKALILGCSHAAGNEIVMRGEDDRENSFAMQLARILGYVPTNRAITGGSNDAMFRLAQQHHDEYDLVIACWTGCNRTEVWDGASWQQIAPGGMPITIESYRQQWLLHGTDETSGRLNKIKNILAANAVCSQIININSFWPVPCDVKWAVPETFCDWCIERNYSHTDFGHFGLDAHTAFAQYVATKFNTLFAKLV